MTPFRKNLRDPLLVFCKLLHKNADELKMNTSPVFGLLKIGIHSRKRARHNGYFTRSPFAKPYPEGAQETALSPRGRLVLQHNVLGLELVDFQLHLDELSKDAVVFLH